MKIRSVFVEYLLTPRPLICDFFFAFPYASISSAVYRRASCTTSRIRVTCRAPPLEHRFELGKVCVYSYGLSPGLWPSVINRMSGSNTRLEGQVTEGNTSRCCWESGRTKTLMFSFAFAHKYK